MICTGVSTAAITIPRRNNRRAGYGEHDMHRDAEIVALQELPDDQADRQADHHEPDVLHENLLVTRGYALLRRKTARRYL